MYLNQMRLARNRAPIACSDGERPNGAADADFMENLKYRTEKHV